MAVTMTEGQVEAAIFMRNVYHHFPEPGPMAASLFRALKPAGRVAVIDFAPGSGKEAARELRQAGFEVLQADGLKRERWYIVVAMRPDEGAERSRSARPTVSVDR